MPSPEQILAGLSAISNKATTVAIIWHLLVLGGLVAVLGRWRPSRRTLAVLLVLPLLSVAGAAWAFGNPFNGTCFIVLAVALGVLGLRLPRVAASRGPTWTLVTGALIAGFGFFYPHFLESGSWLSYLYAAPTGLVPCPTISLVIGLALVADGLGSRAWCLTLAAAGLFYGLFGILRLGVYLDVGLLFGAAALFVRGIGYRAAAP